MLGCCINLESEEGKSNTRDSRGVCTCLRLQAKHMATVPGRKFGCLLKYRANIHMGLKLVEQCLLSHELLVLVVLLAVIPICPQKWRATGTAHLTVAFWYQRESSRDIIGGNACRVAQIIKRRIGGEAFPAILCSHPEGWLRLQIFSLDVRSIHCLAKCLAKFISGAQESTCGYK